MAALIRRLNKGKKPNEPVFDASLLPTGSIAVMSGSLSFALIGTFIFQMFDSPFEADAQVSHLVRQGLACRLCSFH